MKPYTYLLINLLTISICFIASFDRRLRFNRHFGAFILAALLVAIPFIAWDIWFTAEGVWWFDSAYTLGIRIAGLPLEEIMFFFFIPFSCVFTYFSFDKFWKWSALAGLNNIVALVTIIVCGVFALAYKHQMYTMITAVVGLLSMVFFNLVARIPWLTQASLIYLILTPGFLLVNGVLTGTGVDSPIVNYNPAHHIGIRIVTIPIEDAVYGYFLFMWNILLFKKFSKTEQSALTPQLSTAELKS